VPEVNLTALCPGWKSLFDGSDELDDVSPLRGSLIGRCANFGRAEGSAAEWAIVAERLPAQPERMSVAVARENRARNRREDIGWLQCNDRQRFESGDGDSTL
jgi:hypothetical protein